MYFVVYLLKLKKNVILPISWIKGADEHFEKFVNNSINSAQKFRCYYTTNQNLFEEDGRPKTEFEPDFNLDYVQNTDGDFDGCFEGKLKVFKLHYEDVVLYKKRHRNVEPSTFNEARLNEMPIPELHDNNNSNDGPAIVERSNTLQENETFSENLPINDSTDENRNGDANQTDPEQNRYVNLFDDQHEDEFYHSEDGNDDFDPLSIDTAQFEIKQEHLDLLENHAGNSDDIEKLLEDEVGEAVNTEAPIETIENEASVNEGLIEDKVDDDITFMVGKSGIPKPKGMRYKLIKRENDPFSGNISFDETEAGRAYEINGELIEIPNKVVNKVILWNEGHERMSTPHDKKICYSLLLCLVPKEQLSQESVSPAVLDFIKACFLVRCDGDRGRVKTVNGYTDELCKLQKQ